jgi:ABC-type polysaccharide/polyol phosphate transport system ATPase subunit
MSDPVIKVLDGINVDILKGECFGIIGPNGTGKSTLLRLIAGIIPPDSGTIKITGSLIPLLSLGVGFTSDLNAHDNIYQYGMLLGFSKKKMDALYDDIIAFSGLEKFQYMPLKNFSSGMRVKLAFSTAVQIDPDILVLDEVLSVGDVAFKEKSQKKILEFCHSDKTVVIVSHSMSDISKLCDRAMFLQDGKICSLGDPSDVIDAYLGVMQQHLEPKEVMFAHKVVRDRAAQEKDQEDINRILNQVSKLNIFSLIRGHYNPDVERFLNEYLTCENLKKVSDLEALIEAKGEQLSRKSNILGSSFISFLNELGDESASPAIADEIIRTFYDDGLVCFGDENLRAFFTDGAGAPKTPGRVTTLLVCHGSRTIPVICDMRELLKIDNDSLLRILKKAHCDRENRGTIVLSPEYYTRDAVATLMDNSHQFLAPVPVPEIEGRDFSPGFFEGVASPDNMRIFNDRPVFIKKGRFELKGKPIEGYGYLNPRHIPPDYNKYFRRLALLRKVFSTTVRAPSISSEAFISQVAKTDSVYFSEVKNNGLAEISINQESILRRQKLMGMVFLYHFGTWDAEECVRNYEIWGMTDQSFKFYQKIMTSDDALNRGKALLSLINTVIQLGVIKNSPFL